LQRTRQTVVFTVAANYLELVAQQEQLRVQQENLEALQAQEEQIKRFVDVGSRPISISISSRRVSRRRGRRSSRRSGRSSSRK
jgi:hypothetical protein